MLDFSMYMIWKRLGLSCYFTGLKDTTDNFFKRNIFNLAIYNLTHFEMISELLFYFIILGQLMYSKVLDKAPDHCCCTVTKLLV